MKLQTQHPEVARIAALHEYQILHTSDEESFDEIVRLAAESCSAPLALINFCAHDKTWSKARYGTDLKEMERGHSFCGHLVETNEILSVSDAKLDPRYAENIYVNESPYIRAYLGIPLTDSEGLVLGSICVIDTTNRDFAPKHVARLQYFARQIMNLLELRKTQSALLATQKELTIQQQTIADTKKHQREFLSNLSHEVRTPLNAILGLSEILKDQGLSASQTRLLQDLTKSGQHLIETLNAFLEHSKMEAGQAKLNLSTFSLKSFVEETLSPFEVLAFNKGVRLTHTINFADHIHCQGDKVRLRQVLNNLVSNSLKFTDSGSIRVEIECTDTRGDESLFAFRVIDTGIGIDKNHHGQLFEPYLQVSGDASKGGTGLGLSICKKIIESMDGQIGLDSDLGKGSTFWFMVAFKTNRIKPEAPSNVMPLTVPRPHLFGRVLLLEDNHISSAVTLNFLEKSGLDVLSARTREESLYLLDTHDFDLILMDLHLGSVLPSTLIHDVREKSCAPVIAVSGTEMSLPEARELGIDDSLQKPYSRDALLKKLQNWLLEPKAKTHMIREWQSSLGRLGDQCGAEFVLDTISNFVARHPGEVLKLHHYLEGSEWDKMELAAHSMKSTLATLGMSHLAGLSSELEDLAMKADVKRIAPVLEQLQTDSRRTINLLTSYVRKEFSTREKAS